MRQLHVHLLPSLFEPAEVRGASVVICDILRASTTMTYALANGAECVVPCGTVEEAKRRKTEAIPGQCLLGGERGGVKIEGFDLSNSPQDYGPDVVRGKTVVFTTTNGTHALLRSLQADEILVGAFVNLSAVADYLNQSPRPIHIVCAGTDGKITSEDVLFAGALAERLLAQKETREVTDSTELAYHHWRAERGDGTSSAIETALRKSQGGRNLMRLGYSSDIALSASIDSVPETGILNSAGALQRIPALRHSC